jgi:PAS domain S-box-containing protein
MDPQNPVSPADSHGPHRLLETLKQMEAVLDSIDNPVWMLDKHFCVRYANQATKAIFHLPPDQIQGKPCWEVVHGLKEPEDHCPLIRASRTGQRQPVERLLGEQWFKAVVNPMFDTSGELAGYANVLTDITATKRAENEMRASEKHLRAILEASTESVFLMDTEGRVVLSNAITAERIKTDPLSLKGKNIYNFLPPELAKHRKRNIQRVIDTGRPFQFEDERFGRHILNSIFPVFGENHEVTHLAVYGMDITKRKRLEHIARKREEIYQSIFKNNHAIMLVIDPETGQITDANPAACTYYGYDLATLNSKKISEINTLTPDQIHEEMARAKNEERNYFLFQHRLASGEIRPVEVYSGPIWIVGRPMLYSIIHDISERRKAEEDKEKLILELQDALSRIKVLNGMLPICASCKKIRNDQGYWQQIESYIKEHSQVDFSHGICPECLANLYPDFKIE